jgi:hypothetical protein
MGYADNEIENSLSGFLKTIDLVYRNDVINNFHEPSPGPYHRIQRYPKNPV